MIGAARLFQKNRLIGKESDFFGFEDVSGERGRGLVPPPFPSLRVLYVSPQKSRLRRPPKMTPTEKLEEALATIAKLEAEITSLTASVAHLDALLSKAAGHMVLMNAALDEALGR
jgi:hypothetical protein